MMNRRILLRNSLALTSVIGLSHVLPAQRAPLPLDVVKDPQLRIQGFINSCASYERAIAHAKFLRQHIRVSDSYLGQVMSDHQLKIRELRKSITAANVTLERKDKLQTLNKIEFVSNVIFASITFFVAIGAFSLGAVPAFALAAGAFITGLVIDEIKLIYEDNPLAPEFVIVYESTKARVIAEIESKSGLFAHALKVIGILKSLKDIDESQASQTELNLKLISMRREADAVNSLLSRYPVGDLSAWRSLIDSELVGIINSFERYVKLNRERDCIFFPEQGPTIGPLR